MVGRRRRWIKWVVAALVLVWVGVAAGAGPPRAWPRPTAVSRRSTGRSATAPTRRSSTRPRGHSLEEAQRRVRPRQRPAVEPVALPVPLPPGPGPAAAGGRPAHRQRCRRLGGRPGHGRRGPRDERGAHPAGHRSGCSSSAGSRRWSTDAQRRLEAHRHPRRRGARRSGRRRADHAGRQAGRGGRRPRPGVERAGFAAEPARRQDLPRAGRQQRRDAGRLGHVPVGHHPHHRGRAPRHRGRAAHEPPRPRRGRRDAAASSRRTTPGSTPGSDFRNLALSPQFAQSAEIASRMWPQVRAGRGRWTACWRSTPRRSGTS